MSGKLQNVVVLAGSGNLGPGVIQELLNAGLTVTATTRQDSNASFPAGVKVVKTDYSNESLVSIFKRQDAVLSLAGATHLTDQIAYADAAIEAGVKRFLPSEFGVDTTDENIIKALPFFGQKRSVIEHLKSKQSTGISWTGLVSGAFFDWGLKMSFLGFDFSKKTAKIYDDGETRFTASTIPTIGKAVASILANPEVAAATANKYIAFQTATLTQNEILAVLQDTSGNQWTVEKLDSKTEIKAAEAEVAKGNHMAFYGILQAKIFGKDEDNVSDLEKSRFGIWNEKLGLPAEDWKQVVKDVASQS